MDKEKLLGNPLLTSAFLSALVLQAKNNASCTVVCGILTDEKGLRIILIWLQMTKQTD